MHYALRAREVALVALLLAVALVAFAIYLQTGGPAEVLAGDSSKFAGAKGSGYCLYSTLGGWQCGA